MTLTRKARDFYPTESKLTLGMLEFCAPAISGHIKEPCNGQGHISNVLIDKMIGDKIETSDIERNAMFAPNWNECDWTITNPPFSSALPILKQALKFSRQGVIFLTRLSFLEPTYQRSLFWIEHRPDLVIVNPRSSFTNDGKTDSVTTCWICYGNFPFKGIQFIPKTK
jgi:hypothetical protein